MYKRSGKECGQTFQRLALLFVSLMAFLLLPGFIRLTPSGEATESNLILVNKTHLLPEDYVPSDLVEVQVGFASGVTGERKKMRKAAAESLERLFEAAKREGVTLVAVSGYRSYRTQENIYAQRLQQSGEEYVSRYIAQAGMSEHQTGLAMDLSDANGSGLNEVFCQTGEYDWLAANAHRFGFIIRYPEYGESETGYAFEPWHVRYVGNEARTIFSSGMTFEKYMHTNYPALTFVQQEQPSGLSIPKK